MANVQIYDFGTRNGVQSYRIMGDREDLHKIVDECRKADARFHDVPTINHVRKGQWTMALKIKLPVKVEK